jgi:hypothetical protein
MERVRGRGMTKACCSHCSTALNDKDPSGPQNLSSCHFKAKLCAMLVEPGDNLPPVQFSSCLPVHVAISHYLCSPLPSSHFGTCTHPRMKDLLTEDYLHKTQATGNFHSHTENQSAYYLPHPKGEGETFFIMHW